MKKEDITAIIEAALKENRPLRIKGYRNSDGQVADYVVRIAGSDGYQSMVKASLEALNDGKVTPPADTPPEVWEAAQAEQKASWEKTLAGESTRSYNDGMELTPGGYYVSAGDPTMVGLRNLEQVSIDVTEAIDKKATVSKPKTLAKAHIRDNTPLANYLGQLNLVPGKFTSIELV